MKIFEVRSAVIVEVNLKDGQSLHLTKGKWSLPGNDPEVIRLVEKQKLFEVPQKAEPVIVAEQPVDEKPETVEVNTKPVADKPKGKSRGKKKSPSSPGDIKGESTK